MTTQFKIYVTDFEAADMLKQLAKDDLRSIGDQTVWIIRQEYARRYSKPTLVTIGEAEAAGAAINPLVAETD